MVFEVESGGSMTVGACYNLKFGADVRESTYTIASGGAKTLVFFGEHVPTRALRTCFFSLLEVGNICFRRVAFSCAVR